jgi:quinol monooxygenase YgiN
VIYVIATIQVVPGGRGEFLQEFHRIVPLVKAEEGCLVYEPTEDVETSIGAQIPMRENVVTVVEQWSSLEALEAHLIAPHMLEYRTRVKTLVANVQLQILRPAPAS